MHVRKLLKRTVYIILTPILLVGLYLLAAWVLWHISVDKEVGTTAEVPVYIMTNGVHTDIVVPVQNRQTDWSRDIPFSDTRSGDTAMQYIAFGWGDKGFYLETPTWADLKFRTAFKAAFALSHAAMHTTFYKTMEEGPDCVQINISSQQYERLAAYIRASFKKDSGGHMMHIVTNANYGANDAFYEAGGSYSLFHTCNTWANNGLKSCGQKACLWTPFDKGIFYQYGR
jgi:uncharacterized protein (TIGR02117 family)